jgi:hypothetical protein
MVKSSLFSVELARAPFAINVPCGKELTLAIYSNLLTKCTKIMRRKFEKALLSCDEGFLKSLILYKMWSVFAAVIELRTSKNFLIFFSGAKR